MPTVYVNVLFKDKGKPDRHLWVFGYDDTKFAGDEVTPALMTEIENTLKANGIIDPDIEMVGNLHKDIKFVGVKPPENPTPKTVSGTVKDDLGADWTLSLSKK